MQSIVSKGKNINEAIILGLEVMESTKKDVVIEIIQNETKGFLGIGSKEAIVKITKNKTGSLSKSTDKHWENKFNLVEEFSAEHSEEPIEHMVNLLSETEKNDTNEVTEQETLEGKACVWVKDGQLFYQSTSTHFPLVTINDDIKLFKNDKLITERNPILSENGTYKLKVENEVKETKWNVSIDNLRLKVILNIEPGYMINRKIVDIEPLEHIEITVEEEKVINNTLTYEEIIQKLERLGVKHGFNQYEILNAMAATEPSSFEIASGKEATSGQDGWIKILVDMNTQSGPIEKDDGTVDYREIKTIPNVEKGKVIGSVYPPIPGQLGCTVTNEPLPAKQTFPIIIKAGKGVITVGDKIVATESGRPYFEQRGQLVKISIKSKLTHTGNVDLTSGNIRFLGDVEIQGDVEERMLVEADGDIIVHKTVSASTLNSSGAIVTYGNVISSEISAGKNNMLVSELGHLLGILHQNTENMITLIEQLTKSPAFKSNDFSRGGLQPLIRILLEKRFKSFTDLAKKYVEVVRKGEDYLDEDEGWRQVGVSLSQFFLSLTNSIPSIDSIVRLSQKMKELHELSKTPVEPDSYITISNAMNSRLYSSGNILILGQGCINTKIHAGGQLKISGTLRGGEVYGRLGVDINEGGSESGIATIIAVPNDQTIKINKAVVGTILKFGNISHKLTDTKFNVIARLDENDRVIFE